MIRFPLNLPPVEEKREPWSRIIGKGLVFVAVVLFLVYVVFPALEGAQ